MVTRTRLIGREYAFTGHLLRLRGGSYILCGSDIALLQELGDSQGKEDSGVADGEVEEAAVVAPHTTHHHRILASPTPPPGLGTRLEKRDGDQDSGPAR